MHLPRSGPGSFAELLLTADHDLFFAVQTGANPDFIANGRADFDASGVHPPTLGVIHEHVGRTLRIANNRFARNCQHPFFRRAEDPGFSHHAGKQHRTRVRHYDLHCVGARSRFRGYSDYFDLTFETPPPEGGQRNFRPGSPYHFSDLRFRNTHAHLRGIEVDY